MWIINESTGTRRLFNDDLLGDLVDDAVEDLPGDGQGVVFDGPTQVTEAVGEALCDHYDDIRPYEAD